MRHVRAHTHTTCVPKKQAFAPSVHTELVTSANVAPLSFTTEEVSDIVLQIVGGCSLEIDSLRKPFGLLSAFEVLAVIEAAHAVEESNGENGSLKAWTKQMNGCLNLEVEGMPEPAVEAIRPRARTHF